MRSELLATLLVLNAGTGHLGGRSIAGVTLGWCGAGTPIELPLPRHRRHGDDKDCTTLCHAARERRRGSLSFA